MGRRCEDADYARFAAATLGLAAAAAGLPRRAQLEMTIALLTVCESDRAARTALGSAEPLRLRQAADALQHARELLADADVDVRRRRTLSLVA